MGVICSNCQGENNPDAKYCSMCGYTLPILESQNNSEISAQPKLKKTKHKQPMSTYIGVIVGVLLSFFITGYFFNPSIDSKLVDFSNEFNKNCPMNIDQFTRINNTVVLPNKTIQYNYTLLGISQADVQYDIFEETLFPRLLETVKTNPDLKLFRDNDVSLKYYYADEAGTFITSYTVTPKMYK